ncbi:hypothetical protein GGI07_000935 [Coemansia sp. Benny D115]|nr:hypothetical protein GGI07_000935 [Coemansia sp. Benny D115]
MAQMLQQKNQHGAGDALDNTLWPAHAQQAALLDSGARRIPSTTLADADELAMGASSGYMVAPVKRQGIIIPAEYTKRSGSISSVGSSIASVESAATSIQPTRSADALSFAAPPQPSSSGEYAAAAEKPAVLLLSPMQESGDAGDRCPVPEPASPQVRRRRLKIATASAEPGVHTGTAYCTSSAPSLLLAAPSPSFAPLHKAALSAIDLQCRARSQSPTRMAPLHSQLNSQPQLRPSFNTHSRPTSDTTTTISTTAASSLSSTPTSLLAPSSAPAVAASPTMRLVHRRRQSQSIAGKPSAPSPPSAEAAAAATVPLEQPRMFGSAATPPPSLAEAASASADSISSSEDLVAATAVAAAAAAAAEAAAQVAASSLPSPQMHASDFERVPQAACVPIKPDTSGAALPDAARTTNPGQKQQPGVPLAAVLDAATGSGFHCADSRFGSAASSAGSANNDDKPPFAATQTCGVTRGAVTGNRRDHEPPSGNPSNSSRAHDLRPESTILMVAATDENSRATLGSLSQPDLDNIMQPAQDSFSQPHVRETNWFKRQTTRSNTNESMSSASSRTLHSDRPQTASGTTSTAAQDIGVSASQQAYLEKMMLRAQEQRDAAMAEAATLQRRLDELLINSDSTIRRLQADLDSATRKLHNEYELRTAAEAKCSQMECELAELSSHIQYEAQNLVAQERREHHGELDRLARRHEEVEQLLEMERAQVGALKKSLETTSLALDRELKRGDAQAASERQVAGRLAGSACLSDESVRLSSAVAAATAAAAAAAALSEPHISGQLFFGNDGSRTDTRLTEFLGFMNAALDKEAMASAFMQRCMREDVAPTLLADASSGLPSLSSWSRHRRLLHSVQENTLVLESFAPRMGIGRVMSLGCYLCACSINRPGSSISSAPPSASSSMSDRGPQQLPTPLSPAVTMPRCEMYRMRFNDNDEDNKPLCLHCHARMVSVCSFFSYLKIVRKGLIKRPIADIWLEVNKTRLQMWLARSGASPDSRVSITMA